MTFLVNLSFPLRIVKSTKVFSGPLTILATSDSGSPFTSFPSIAVIMSPFCKLAYCAGVPSITLMICTLPEFVAIFTPIPVILELIDEF